MKTLILTFAAVVLVSLSSISQMKQLVTYKVNGIQKVANASSDKYSMQLSDTISIVETDVLIFVNQIDNNHITKQTNYNEIDFNYHAAISTSSNIYDQSNMPVFSGDSHLYFVTLFDINGNSVFIYLKITSKSAGIESISEESISLNVYPNPTIDFLTVSFDSKQSKKDIEVYSLSGEMVMLESNERQFGQNDLKLDVQHLPSGMYIVKVDNKTFKVNKL